eukprot:gene11062-7693_t
MLIVRVPHKHSSAEESVGVICILVTREEMERERGGGTLFFCTGVGRSAVPPPAPLQGRRERDSLAGCSLARLNSMDLASSALTGETFYVSNSYPTAYRAPHHQPSSVLYGTADYRLCLLCFLSSESAYSPSPHPHTHPSSPSPHLLAPTRRAAYTTRYLLQASRALFLHNHHSTRQDLHSLRHLMDGNYGDQRRGRGGYPPSGGYAVQGDQQRQPYAGYAQQTGYPMQNAYPSLAQQPQSQPQSQPQPQQSMYAQQQQAPYNAAAYAPGVAYPYARGGYTQQMPPYMQQQAYGMQQQLGGYNPMYGQQQRQPYAPGGYRGGAGGYGQGYNQGYQGGRGRGGRGGFQGDGQRGGRGGRGGFGQRGQRHELLCLIHVDSFATLGNASRSGTFATLMPQKLLENRPHGHHVFRLLVVVGKTYLAAAVSEPRESQDIVLAEPTSKQFMNVENVLCDEGHLLVEMESGDKLAKNLYGQLRHGLQQIAPFDREPDTAGDAEADVYTMEVEGLLKDMATQKPIFRRLEEAVKEDSERSTTLFDQLLQLSSPSLAAPDGEQPAEGAGQEGSATATTATSAAPRRTHMLLRSPQGVRLLSLALEVPSKRQVFFRRLREEGQEVARTRSGARTAPEGTLFLTLLSSVLTSTIVFNSFGVETRSSGSSVAKAAWADRDEIVDTLCTRVAEEGILLLRSNGGSCMVMALTKRLRPGFKVHEPPRSERRTISASATGGFKRGRQGDADGAGRSVKTESGAVPTQAAEASPVPTAPASLDAFAVPEPPLDWRFFHACAAAFTEGRVPERVASKEGEEAAPPPTEQQRIPLITDHIISCRAVQVLLPHFADSVLTHEKESNGGAVPPSTYVRQCSEFLGGLAQRAKELMLHAFGNYVAQSLVTELAPRAIPGTRIAAIVKEILDAVIESVSELSLQKCASNAVERAITASESLPDGHEFILRASRAMLENDTTRLVELATNQYANYVVSHLCKRLTALVVSGNYPEAAAVEKEFFTRLSGQMNALQTSRFSAGLVGWLNAEESHIAEEGDLLIITIFFFYLFVKNRKENNTKREEEEEEKLKEPWVFLLLVEEGVFHRYMHHQRLVGELLGLFLRTTTAVKQSSESGTLWPSMTLHITSPHVAAKFIFISLSLSLPCFFLFLDEELLQFFPLFFAPLF